MWFYAASYVLSNIVSMGALRYNHVAIADRPIQPQPNVGFNRKKNYQHRKNQLAASRQRHISVNAPMPIPTRKAAIRSISDRRRRVGASVLLRAKGVG
jgi:hypothetical protein